MTQSIPQKREPTNTYGFDPDDYARLIEHYVPADANGDRWNLKNGKGSHTRDMLQERFALRRAEATKIALPPAVNDNAMAAKSITPAPAYEPMPDGIAAMASGSMTIPRHKRAKKGATAIPRPKKNAVEKASFRIELASLARACEADVKRKFHGMASCSYVMHAQGTRADNITFGWAVECLTRLGIRPQTGKAIMQAFYDEMLYADTGVTEDDSYGTRILRRLILAAERQGTPTDDANDSFAWLPSSFALGTKKGETAKNLG
jgi:hypothetical protein